MIEPGDPMTTPDHGAATAICECSHHWQVHAESGQTAQSAICHGYTGSATPGPFEPCRCTGFRPWSGPRDARTGEPVKPLTMTVDARAADAQQGDINVPGVVAGMLDAKDARIAELEALAADMLSRFAPAGDGHRARAGQVQITRWRKTLDGGS